MRCRELTIRTAKTEQDDDEIELTVPHGGKDLKVLIRVGAEALWIRDVDGALAGEGIVLRFDEHIALETARETGDWTPPVEEPLKGVRHPGYGPTPSDCGERGGGNQPPGWTAAGDPDYLASVAALAPERTRRTDDGTYPNVGEELAKVDERARAGSKAKTCNFDPDLPPHNPHNVRVAEEKGVSYDRMKGVYRDKDGCPTYDKFGQKL